MAHEFAHEMLHHTDNGERPTKTVRDTEAEAEAFVVSQAVGLDTNTASSDYIQLYAGSKATLAASLDRIQHAATLSGRACGDVPELSVLLKAGENGRALADKASDGGTHLCVEGVRAVQGS